MNNIPDKLEEYREVIIRSIERKNLLLKTIADLEKNIEDNIIHTESLEKVSVVLKIVAGETQSYLKIHIDNIVSLALDSVFPNKYTFTLNFVERRGTIEADILLIRKEVEIDPMSTVGGGVVDILAFSLQIAVWSLRNSAPTIVLDEPFRNLSKDLQQKASEMLKELATRLKIQFIIISHEDGIINSADKYFKVTQINGVSEVTEEKL